jgi:hypothetical protein
MNKTQLFASLLIGGGLWLVSCSDDSVIGESLANDEISITIDSAFKVSGHSVYVPDFDSRSRTLILGGVNVPEYGKLSASFVTQLMSATAMNISDTIPVDSVCGMNLKLSYRRQAITGDSLAPCQVKVFALNKDLPSDIMSNFDPTGYYDPSSPIGVKNYTASALGRTDSLYKTDLYGHISIPVSLDLAKSVFNRYRNDPSVFQWPSTFVKYFPGLYVENTFGSGCVVNITVGEVALYYNYGKREGYADDDGVYRYRWVSAVDSVTLFSTAPEVLSSNNLSVKISDNITSKVAAGEPVLFAPNGYHVRIKFPTQDIINKYWSDTFNVGMVNNLTFSLPVSNIKNDYGITPPPYLLMVRTCDLDTFFENNSVPDNVRSFWGTYASSTGLYTFTSMRDYIVDIMDKYGTEVPEDDTDFTLVPVNITTETVTDSSTGSSKVVVTYCAPFILRPTMGLLDFDRASVKFIFSRQKQ